MLKEAYEDYQRYKSDSELNNRQTLLYDYGLGDDKQVKWSEIKPGDIVKVEKD